MRLLPYESFAGVPFGGSEAAVVAQLGEPKGRRRNTLGEHELDYGPLIVRVAEGGGVQEMSAQPREGTVLDETVPLAAFPERLRVLDPSAVADLGFLVSLRLGVAVDTEPEHGN